MKQQLTEKTALCTCNMCGGMFADTNPQTGQPEYEVRFGQFIALDDHRCPVCKSDDYLMDYEGPAPSPTSEERGQLPEDHFLSEPQPGTVPTPRVQDREPEASLGMESGQSIEARKETKDDFWNDALPSHIKPITNPATQPEEAIGEQTEWKLNANETFIYVRPVPKDGGDIICLAPDMGDSLDKWKENAKKICSIPSLIKENGELRKYNEQLKKENSLKQNIIEYRDADLQQQSKDIEELREALKPLANLDLVGVTGEIIYVRDKTQITVTDVNTAKTALHQTENK